MGWRRWGLALAGAASLASCLVYSEDLLVEGDGGGGVGASGGAPECTLPNDCPGMDTTCSTRTCDAGQCGLALAPAATPCTEGGQVCDGQGACVECVDASQCTSPQICNNSTCVAPMSLPNGAPCSVDAACMSNQCADDVCCNSACAALCMACDLIGNEGTCGLVPAGMDPHGDCAPDTCNGMGACACGDGQLNGMESDVDCGGACMGCGFGQGCNSGADCLSANCNAGSCAPLCGDGATEGSEQCDDNGTEPFDGCSPACLDETSHLVISEIVVSPTAAEMVEIYNPSGSTVPLSNVWLADYDTYYLLTVGGGVPSSTDFRVTFPAGATIAPGGFVVVSLESASGFLSAYGMPPNFDLDAADAGAPAMLGTYTGSSGLTNGDEMLVLFEWDNSSDLVIDLDYLVWGNTSDAADKTGVTVGASTYAPDTPIGAQAVATSPGDGKSLHRCDTAESTEMKTGGNGSSGHDETSEDSGVAFFYDATASPSPKAPPPVGFCP